MTPTETVKVELAPGKTYHLRYTNSALYRLEDQSGMAFEPFNRRVMQGSVKAITQFVWAGLLHAEPDLKIETVIDRIDLRNFEQIAEAAGRAVALAFGQDPDEAEAETEEAENPPMGVPSPTD